jgi:hypothetical protein
MRARRLWSGLLGTLMLAVLPTPAGAQAVGSEFQINTYTTGTQRTNVGGGLHQVAADASGNFVVVWESDGQDGSQEGVFGQRYDRLGGALGSEFRVNSFTSSIQNWPSVASDTSGNFVVVWTSFGQGIVGQRYDSEGVAQGGEFLVVSYTTGLGHQILPSVASDASGNFVVAWEGYGQDGSDDGILGQRYDSAGNALGSNFQVNSYGTGYQRWPSVASDATGNYVVVWLGEDQDGHSAGIFGQRYDSAGGALGSEFQVNSYTTGAQWFPSIASDANGNFVVAWMSGDGSNWGVFGQRYDSGGVAQGSEFRVNSYTTNAQYFPSVASDASGDFVIAWSSYGQDGGDWGTFGQRYDNDGVALGKEFQINSFTTGRQRSPSVAVTGNKKFIVAWGSYDQDGGGGAFGAGVFGQRFDFGGLPSLSIADISVREGNPSGDSKRTPARFTVSLSAPSAQTVTVQYATADGTATAPSDYKATSGTLTFNPGQTSGSIVIAVRKDLVVEPTETFFVNLSSPTNATIADGQAVGTIRNDDQIARVP